MKLPKTLYTVDSAGYIERIRLSKIELAEIIKIDDEENGAVRIHWGGSMKFHWRYYASKVAAKRAARDVIEHYIKICEGKAKVWRKRLATL